MSELVLINPRRRRRKSARRKGRMPPALAKYWAGKRRRKTRAPSRRRARSRRRRVAVYGGIAAPYSKLRRRRLRNPRRRRHHASRIRRRRVHRNPRFGLPNVNSIVRSTLMPAAVGATGALALDVAMGYATPYLPTFLQSKWALLAVKIAGAVGIGMVAGKFLGRERGRVATLGAATVVVYGAAKSALASAMPSLPGLSGYADFVDYSVRGRGVGAYMPPQMGFYSPAAVVGNGMGAYMQPSMSGIDGGYNWRDDGM